MRSTTFQLDASSDEVLDITAEVRGFAGSEDDGLVHVFLPHATCGLAIFELHAGTESDVRDTIDRLLPRDHAYQHRHGSPGHGADHVLPAFVSPSLTVPVVGGEVQLGTWQSIVVVDTNRDNPRRTVRLSFLPA